MENKFDFDLIEDFMQLHRLMAMQLHQNRRGHGPFASPYSGQGRVLKLLALKPETTQKELAEILDMRPQSLGELLGKLEKNGYITRAQSQTDKRVMEVTLTEKGQQAAVRETAARPGQELFGCLSDEEQLQLHTLLCRLMDHMEAACPQHFCGDPHGFSHPGHHHGHGGGPHGHHGSMQQERFDRHGRQPFGAQHFFAEGLHEDAPHDQHHGRQHAGDAAEDSFSMIAETKDFCAASHYDLEQIHCNGCQNACPLSQPHCGRGAMLQQKFQELQ